MEFITISDKDTPYYQFLHNTQNLQHTSTPRTAYTIEDRSIDGKLKEYLPHSEKASPLTHAFLARNTSSSSLTKLNQLFFLPFDKYLIGRGQSSLVYRASFRSNGSSKSESCCVKQMNKSLIGYGIGKRESLLLSELNHPSIIKLIDTKQEDSSPSANLLLILEYCSNGDIFNWMSGENGKRISRKLFLKWSRQISAGVEYLHKRGIIHHDIKPHNILLTDLLDAKISDFGSSYKADSPSLGLGTTGYIAPEMYASKPKFSFPVDMYSTGVTLFTIITQISPFGLCRTSIQIIIKSQRGFFEEGCQACVPSWKRPDPSDLDWQFGSGEPVDKSIVDLILNLVALEPQHRLSAEELTIKLDVIE